MVREHELQRFRGFRDCLFPGTRPKGSNAFRRTGNRKVPPRPSARTTEKPAKRTYLKKDLSRQKDLPGFPNFRWSI
eukprot:59814-Rhodomonas_salina.2